MLFHWRPREISMEYKHGQLGEFVQRRDIQQGQKLNFFKSNGHKDYYPKLKLIKNLGMD